MVLSETLRGDLEKGAANRDAIAGELEVLRKTVNESLDPHEQLDFVVVVKQPWLIENGFLTPTMKVKRGSLEDVYGPKIPSWYGEKSSIIWES